MEPVQVCARCVLDASVPGVTFDAEGICNHCRLHDRLDQQYALNEANKIKFDRIVQKIKRSGRGQRYDCIVGLSGGVDSTYCLYKVRELGLRPLAIHYDNGWVADIARQNIEHAVRALDVDLRVVAPPRERLHTFHRACLNASIPETCLPCEIGIVSALYDIAAREHIRYIILGTSFRTEGINPLRWHYVDGAYFNDIVRKHGEGVSARGFNKLTAWSLFKYILLKGIKTVQLPLYIEYRNEHIIPILEQELGWRHGGRHHFDCFYKPFGSYVETRKFNRDPKKVSLAALVRNGELSRERALEQLRQSATASVDNEAVAYCRRQLNISTAQFDHMLSARPKIFLDYRTYYWVFCLLRGPIKLGCKLKLIPETLYEKLFTVV